MKKVSDVFKSIRFAQSETRGKAHSSTDDEEHGAIGEVEWEQQIKHAKKRAMQEEIEFAEDLNEQIQLLDEMPGANMDTRAVHKHLKKQGWSLTRSSGGHDVFTHPDAKHHIPVPRHRQLKAPLVRGILKQSEVRKEEVEQLEEGRPSQRHPLEGHEYHRKTDAELEYIAKDAHKAAEAMKSHNTAAENKYRDQASDSATVRYFRKKNGMPNWYKKKYGHVNESVALDIAKSAARRNAGIKEEVDGVEDKINTPAKASLSRTAGMVKDLANKAKTKNKSKSEDKFNPDPEFSSQIMK